MYHDYLVNPIEYQYYSNGIPVHLSVLVVN